MSNTTPLFIISLRLSIHALALSLRLPKNFSGVVIANEVLDAMPAKRLINQTDGFKELGVDCQDDKLVWQVFFAEFLSTTTIIAFGWIIQC
jgi:SAM-dependent MidA family methyltransferase